MYTKMTAPQTSDSTATARNTTTTTTTTNNGSESPSLMTLPPELRLQIYKHLFATLTSTSQATSPARPTEHDIFHSTAILHTSRQLFAEAGEDFLNWEHRLQKTLSIRCYEMLEAEMRGFRLERRRS